MVAHIAGVFHIDPAVVLDDQFRFDLRLACLRVLQKAGSDSG